MRKWDQQNEFDVQSLRQGSLMLSLKFIACTRDSWWGYYVLSHHLPGLNYTDFFSIIALLVEMTWRWYSWWHCDPCIIDSSAHLLLSSLDLYTQVFASAKGLVLDSKRKLYLLAFVLRLNPLRTIKIWFCKD